MSGIMKPPLGRKITWGHPLANGLVGCWLFNEGSGNKTFDLSGNRNDGSLINTVENDWILNNYGHAINFVAGNSAYLDTADSSILNIIQEITIVHSLSLSSQPASGLWFVFTEKGASNDLGYNTQYYYDATNYRIESVYWKDAAANIPSIIFQMNLNQTYVIAWSHSALADYMYIDGSSASFGYRAGTFKSTFDSPIGYNFQIGRRTNPDINRYLDGTTDYVYVYNRALTSSDISWLYAEPFAMFECPDEKIIKYFIGRPIQEEEPWMPTLRGYPSKPRRGAIINLEHPLARDIRGCWLFNEGQGGDVFDYSPIGNKASFVNMDPATDWVVTELGYSVDIEATNQRLTTPAHSLYKMLEDISLTMAFYITDNGLLFAIELTAGGGSDNNSIIHVKTTGTTNKDIVYKHEYSSGSAETITFNTNLPQNAWYWLTITRDSVRKTVDLYVNGNYFGTGTYSNQPTCTSSAIPIFMGSRSDNSLDLAGRYGVVFLHARKFLASDAALIYCDPYDMFEQFNLTKYFISIVAGISLSKTRQIIMDYLFQPLKTRQIPLNYSIQLLKTREIILDNLKGIIGLRANQFDYLSSILSTRAILLEDLIQSSNNREVKVEYLKAFSTIKSAQIEWLVQAIRTRNIIFDFLKLIQSTYPSMFDFSIPVIKTKGIDYEYLIPVTRSNQISLDNLKGIRDLGEMGLNYLGQPSPGRLIPYSYLVQLSTTRQAPIGFLKALSNQTSTLIEILKGIIQLGTIRVEWTATAAVRSITLDSSSVYKNILKSFNKYLVDQLITGKGLSLNWGQPNFKEEGLERWIESILGWDERLFQRQINSTQQGNVCNVRVEINLYELYPPRRNIYTLDGDKDSVIEELELANIPIYDYDTAGAPQVGELRVFELFDETVLDGGEESGVKQEQLIFAGKYLEKFTKN